MDKIITFRDGIIESQFDHTGLNVLRNIARIEGVVTPVVALPDFHYKQGMEAPSSISVGVKKYLIPHFTSSSVNCGMGAVATPFTADDIEAVIPEFYNHIRQNRSESRYRLSQRELFSVMMEGPAALADRYEISDRIIDSFENRGKLNGLEELGLKEVVSYIPPDVLNHHEYNGMEALGIGFGGNHFLEIQKVAEIFDPESCRANGIEEIGQIVVMYHGGGGIIPGFLGGYFARRTKGYNNTLRFTLDKLRYHSRRVGSLRSLPEMYRYYFSPRRYVRVPENTAEGQRFIHTISMGMNYGYAYRLFMIIRIRDALQHVLGGSARGIHLIRDISHNSIQKELIDDNELWVHRHNAARVNEGEVTVLPGYNNTSSYICQGMGNTASTLHTVPHGAGDSIKAYREIGLTKSVEGRFTALFRNMAEEPEMRMHESDEGIDNVVRSLERNNVMRPLARTTPLAVLKQFR